MSISVRILGSEDAPMLDHVAPGVFDNDINPAWTTEFFSDTRHHLVVALDDETVVGMASGVIYVHPDKSPALWVNEIGVAPAYQQRGIGRRLMEALFEQGRKLGCHEAWLGTEPDNIAARRLYSAVGGIETPMMMFEFDLTR